MWKISDVFLNASLKTKAYTALTGSLQISISHYAVKVSKMTLILKSGTILLT